MDAQSYFDAVRALPLATVEALTGGKPFVVFSPHPDDETLGAGGLIASACAKKQSVTIIAITDGSRSHPSSRAYPHPQLIELRRRELENAALALGLGSNRICHLNLPDSEAPHAGPAFDRARQTVLPLVQKLGARCGFVTWEGDPHCDHEAAAALAKAVRNHLPEFQLWAYPIWGWHLDAGSVVAQPPPSGYRIDISPHLKAKRAAINEHASQMTDLIDDDPLGFRFTDETLAPFLGHFEYFLEVPAA